MHQNAAQSRRGKGSRIKLVAYFHMRAPVLEPELDLDGPEAELLGQGRPLLAIWVGAVPEEAAPKNKRTHARMIREASKATGGIARVGGGDAYAWSSWIWSGVWRP
jgi:hypothetical protein